MDNAQENREGSKITPVRRYVLAVWIIAVMAFSFAIYAAPLTRVLARSAPSLQPAAAAFEKLEQSLLKIFP